MKTILRPEEPETIKCEICLGQIPSDGGISIESDDYVFHYSGIACYQRRKQQAAATLTGCRPGTWPGPGTALAVR